MSTPTPPRPPIVMNWSKATSLTTGLVATIGAILVAAGYLDPTQVSQLQQAVTAIVAAVSAVVAVVVPLIHGRRAAAQVTPTVDPVSHAGEPLLTEVQWEAEQYGRHALAASLYEVQAAGEHGAQADDVLRTAISDMAIPDAPRPQPGPRTEPYAQLRANADNMEEPPVTDPMTQRFQLGRLPNDPSKPRVRLTALEAPVSAWDPPAAVDWYSKVPASSWGMDGNDRVGDCTCAEVDHTVKALQVAAGNSEVTSKTAEVLALYSAVTGYDPNQTDAQGNNPTDNGAQMQDVRNWWRKHGVKLGGQSHTILLFAQVDHSDHALIKWCIARFGEVGFGFDFPASAMTQFNAGQPWTVVAGSKIEGGHAVGAVGYDDQFVYVTTWGTVQKMAWSFFDKYVTEAWTQLSSEFVNATTGDDELGETLYQLGQQYAAATGQPNPIPAPAPGPPPPPEPGPTPPPPPAPAAQIPADWVTWARHALTLRGQSHLTVQVAREILAAAGQ